jgi:hypothetical protein
VEIFPETKGGTAFVSGGCIWELSLMFDDLKRSTAVISVYHKIGYKDDPVVVLSKRLYEDEPYDRNA